MCGQVNEMPKQEPESNGVRQSYPSCEVAKILDLEWQASALLVKLLIRGLSAGYEPWKTLVRHRVTQTKQSKRGRWPAHANWIMNSAQLVQQGSTMWQGVMKA